MKLAQIDTLIKQIKGSTFASMDTITEVKLKGGKKNPHQGRVVKRTIGNRVQLFTSYKGYTNMVNRRRKAEGNMEEFVSAPLPWGERVGDTPIIENKGKFYLQVIFQKAGESEYLLDNKVVDPETLEGFAHPEKTSGRQEIDVQQNIVIVRTFSLDSIREIRMMGEAVQG